jgi:DNA-binding MarR family transcriptional regulator
MRYRGVVNDMLPIMRAASDTALSTVLDLARARTLILREVDASIGMHHGIGLSDLGLLLELQAAPGQRMRRVDLAHRLGVTTSGVARQLAPLERIGLVGREPSPGDARLALVVLSEAGARVASEALPTAEHGAERALGQLWQQDEQRALGFLLRSARA